jgi:protein-L-isoaspartate O-methyltransferase
MERSGLLLDPRQSDEAFDAQFPDWVSTHSKIHWTPLSVVRKVLSVFCDRPGVRILDVGSGSGKFCLAGAALLEEAHFTGVEQRSALVEMASALAQKASLSNLNFVCADAFDLDWSEFDALYFYNPFAEHIFFNAFERIDCDAEVGRCEIPWSAEQHRHFTNQTYQRLKFLEMGTRVATYHGFGKEMPPGYTQIYSSGQKKAQLRIWEKTGW